MQKTAYELRISDWSSDVCSSDLGLARLHTRGGHPALDAMLARIQNDLFDLGADLCYPEESKDARGRLQVTDTQVERLAREIEMLNGELEDRKSVVEGKRVSIRLDIGGRRIYKTKIIQTTI